MQIEAEAAVVQLAVARVVGADAQVSSLGAAQVCSLEVLRSAQKGQESGSKPGQTAQGGLTGPRRRGSKRSRQAASGRRAGEQGQLSQALCPLGT